MSGINTNNQDEDDLAKELVLIANFIRHNYSTLTLSEMDLAINLSLTNKLDVDVRTFNVFSPMYVSRILNAFIDYKKQIMVEVRIRKENNDTRTLMEKQPTPEEKMQSMIDLIQYFYDEYLKDGIINDHFNSVYLFLERNKMINPSEETILESVKYGKEMANKYITNLFVDSLNTEKPKREYIEKRYARNYLVQKYFKTYKIDNLVKRINVSQFQ